MTIINLADHASNMDPTAELVSPYRADYGVYRVRGGFIACHNGKAFDGLFADKDKAEAAAKMLLT